MRLLGAALGGLVLEAFAGLVWFCVILLTPSSIPNDDGGGPLILPLIAAGFVVVGGRVGSIVGLLLGCIYYTAAGIMALVSRLKRRGPKPKKGGRRRDDLFD